MVHFSQFLSKMNSSSDILQLSVSGRLLFIWITHLSFFLSCRWKLHRLTELHFNLIRHKCCPRCWAIQWLVQTHSSIFSSQSSVSVSVAQLVWVSLEMFLSIRWCGEAENWADFTPLHFDWLTCSVKRPPTRAWRQTVLCKPPPLLVFSWSPRGVLIEGCTLPVKYTGDHNFRHPLQTVQRQQGAVKRLAKVQHFVSI